MAIRVCKDRSDREGTSAWAAIYPPGGLIHHLLTAEASFPSKRSSLSIIQRVSRLVPASQPHCKIHLNAYQPTNYRPQTCLGCLSQ